MKMTIDYSKRTITLIYFEGEEEARDECWMHLRMLAYTSRTDGDEVKYRIQYKFTSNFKDMDFKKREPENHRSVIDITPISWMTSFESIVADCKQDLAHHLQAVEATTVIPWSPWALLSWAGKPEDFSFGKHPSAKLD